MARIRSIHPGAPLDEDVATMSVHARLVWAYLPCFADKAGRLRDSAFTLKASILPGDDVDMAAILDELAARKHVIRYEVDGRRYIEIRNFKRYQNPHKKELPSTIPDPWQVVTGSPGKTGSSPGETGTSPAVRSGSDPGPIKSESGSAAPAPARSNERAKIWKATDWLKAYGLAWAEHYQQLSYGQQGDSKACPALDDVLDGLTPAERAAAQSKAPDMIAEFLRRADQRTADRRHPFSFFVQEWGGLRVPKKAVVGPETFADRDARMARERAERDRRSTERTVAATTEKLERDRAFTPPTPEQQEEIRRSLADLAESKAVA